MISSIFHSYFGKEKALSEIKAAWFQRKRTHFFIMQDRSFAAT